jgi:hypothetical protein
MGKLSKVSNGGRERGKWADSNLKKGRGICTPPGIVAVAVLQGRIFQSKFGLDNPPPAPPPEILLRTLHASPRSVAGYFGHPRNQLRTLRASSRFGGGLLGRIFPFLAG